MKATDEEVIDRFERKLTGEDAFRHADHVRLAFAYLAQYPVLEALGRFAIALQRFAVSRGKSELYNETITYAYFFLIRERMARTTGTDWDEFARGNPDLLVWNDGILNRYYRGETLQSDFARSVFTFPDKFCP